MIVEKYDENKSAPSYRYRLDISGAMALSLARIIGATSPEQRSVQLEIDDQTNLEIEEFYKKLIHA